MRDLNNHRDALSINTATFGHRRPIHELIELVASRGIGQIAPWRRELEDEDVAEVARHIRDAGLGVSGFCPSTYFTQPTAQARKDAIVDNVRALEQASTLGAACFVLVVGGLPGGSRDLPQARQQVKDGVAELLQHAQRLGVPLALEPLHPMTTADRSCLNTLGEALDWCEEIDPASCGYLGVAIDAYHVWWDPALIYQTERACRAKRVLAFHVCDWLYETRDLALDRGMMGDGIIDLRNLRNCLEAHGYAGPVEVEIFSAANWWRRPEALVLDTCVDRLTSVC
jgi:sugar phosphate isomerase/epimerase